MKNNVELFLLGFGAVLLLLVAFELIALLGETAPVLMGAALLALLGAWTRRYVTLAQRRRKAERAQKPKSPEVAALVLELYGEYPPYVVEAAQQLGKARDRTAVPALIHVLEQAAENQRPGWRDVAAALADALGGDGRALDRIGRAGDCRD